MMKNEIYSRFCTSILKKKYMIPGSCMYAYICVAASFAQPVLNHILDLMHQTCPETEEKIKWGYPITITRALWPPLNIIAPSPSGKVTSSATYTMCRIKTGGNPWGKLGKQISPADLPSDEIVSGLIKEAMKLTDEGIRLL